MKYTIDEFPAKRLLINSTGWRSSVPPPGPHSGCSRSARSTAAFPLDPEIVPGLALPLVLAISVVTSFKMSFSEWM